MTRSGPEGRGGGKNPLKVGFGMSPPPYLACNTRTPGVQVAGKRVKRQHKFWLTETLSRGGRERADMRYLADGSNQGRKEPGTLKRKHDGQRYHQCCRGRC
jgi:hypothetical protein